MKKIKTSCIVVSFALIIGCVSQQPGASPTNETPQTATVIQSPEALTLLAPDISSTPSKPGFAIQSYCPEVIQDTNMAPGLSGTLVLSGNEIMVVGNLYSPEPDQESLILFWKPESAEITTYQLPRQSEYYYYVTSPNKEKLSFTEGKTLSMSSDLMVLNHNGEENGKFTLPDDWNLFDWLNDEVLLVRQNRLQHDKNELIAINPAAGEQQILPANFPNLYSRETLVGWGALTIFDPTASFVLYPQREENKLVPILWNVDNNKEIARIVGNYQPRWSPDGKQLLIVANYQSTPTDFDHDEIFLVTPDGNEARVTFFKDHFERNFITLPVWSPDGRYVAFWLSTDTSVEVGNLAVLDTETSTVDLYCNEFAPFPFRFGSEITLGYAYNQVNSAPPIWSPDSQYLLVENYEQFISSTYLIGLRNHTIANIVDNARPVGWLK